jgi:allantoicase
MSKPDFTKLTDLAAPRLGSKVVYTTDDFFADKARLIDPMPPVFIPDKYDDNGKWMDGWESRRKRVSGHDFAVIQLGRSGRIEGFELDTSHFTGNYPPFGSIEVANSDEEIPADDEWREIVARSPLQGDSVHCFDVNSDQVWTHVRLHIYPDGGVARLRVYGQVFIDWDKFDTGRIIDLAALEFGGQALDCNDAHFGTPENMIAPGKGINMGDGWETRRRREPGNDWAVLALAHKGLVERILIDTAYFKGNYPDKASIQAADCTGLSDTEIVEAAEGWPELLAPSKLEMDREHEFENELNQVGSITHVRLNIYPDGGISRLRLLGKITD